MKKLSEYKAWILSFLAKGILWAGGFEIAIVLWDFVALSQVLAWVIGALCLIFFLVHKLVREPARVPGYYWVMFDRCGDGAEWMPGELIDGRWWVVRGLWSLREDEIQEIGARIER